MTLDLFQVITKIYTSKSLDWVNDISDKVYNVPILLILSYNKRLYETVSFLSKYVYKLNVKHFSILCWSMIQPKYIKSPYNNKIKVLENNSKYDFLLDKIKHRLLISNNDWLMVKNLYLNDIKNNTKQYLTLFGCNRQEWEALGYDLDKPKEIKKQVTGLNKWF